MVAYSYARVVAKNIAKVDIMLQVIMCPDDPPAAFVDLYLVLIPCQSFSDFQKMLDLKGVRRTEQNNLLDIFLAKTSLLRDLADSSFLTSIEMDGTGQVQISNVGAASASGVGQVGASGGGLGLAFPGIMPTSPNSALAHNLNLFMGSLPMLQSASVASGGSTRAGTPQMGHAGSNQGFGGTGPSAPQPSSIAETRPFGFKQIGRLFSMDVVNSGH